MLELTPPTPDEPFVFNRQFGAQVAVSADVGTSTHEDFKAWLRSNTDGWVRHDGFLQGGSWMINVGDTQLLFADSMVFAFTNGEIYAKRSYGRLSFLAVCPSIQQLRNAGVSCETPPATTSRNRPYAIDAQDHLQSRMKDVWVSVKLVGVPKLVRIESLASGVESGWGMCLAIEHVSATKDNPRREPVDVGTRLVLWDREGSRIVGEYSSDGDACERAIAEAACRCVRE